MMKHLALVLALGAFVIGSAGAADRMPPEDADIAAKSAQIESLRARASLSPVATTSATLIEADNLLRQLRQAPPDKRLALRSQLETALIRLELEIDAAGRGKQ